jgi:DNA topoisomerase-1
MQIAQQLYEGIKLPGEKVAGLITYMRTDSTAVSPEAAQEARQVIEQYFPAGLPARPPVYRTRVKNAQEAHEAIRPTSPLRTPKEIRSLLSADQDKLYALIWRRFIASQMKPAAFDVTVVTVATSQGKTDLPYLFRATGRRLVEAGFLQVYDLKLPSSPNEAPDQTLPPLAQNDPLVCHHLLPEQHYTKPPSHFTEATLIQTLEKEGIGRPSTFASILDTLYRRQYVNRDRKALLASPLGFAVSDFLTGGFAATFELGFTARMEDQLDEISNGRAPWKTVVRSVWEPLEKQIAQTQADLAGKAKIKIPGYGYKSYRKKTGRRKPPAEPIGEACPDCGKPLVRRSGKHGPFIGCSGYPQCKYTRALPKKS